MMRGYDACETAIDVCSLKVKSLDFKVHEFEVPGGMIKTLPQGKVYITGRYLGLSETRAPHERR